MSLTWAFSREICHGASPIYHFNAMKMSVSHQDIFSAKRKIIFFLFCCFKVNTDFSLRFCLLYFEGEVHLHIHNSIKYPNIDLFSVSDIFIKTKWKNRCVFFKYFFWARRGIWIFCNTLTAVIFSTVLASSAYQNNQNYFNEILVYFGL